LCIAVTGSPVTADTWEGVYASVSAESILQLYSTLKGEEFPFLHDSSRTKRTILKIWNHSMAEAI
jgi:hypothetical protein